MPTSPPIDEVAPAGPDGHRAAELLQSSKDYGTDVLAKITREAVQRLLEKGNHNSVGTLFNADELNQLRKALEATLATANLLGRAKIRERMRHLQEKRAGVSNFAESEVFAVFADSEPEPRTRAQTAAGSSTPPPPVQPLPPRQAIDYFQSLVPELGVDVRRFGPLLQRQAFTLAVATDRKMLDRVKSSIEDTLISGRRSGKVADIQDILDEAGVAPENPQYSEMLLRTNVMDSYNLGSMQELRAPTVRDFFKAWQYLAIVDSRSRPEHADKNENLYPSEAPFALVRGVGPENVCNCRCSFRAVDSIELTDLERKGLSLEDTW